MADPLSNLATKTVECGCTLILNHRAGAVLLRCSGSDGAFPTDVISLDRSLRRACPGGLLYEVTAEVVERVEYDARPIPGDGAA